MRKAIFSLAIALSLLVGSTVHANNVLSLDDLLGKVETSPTIKAMDMKLTGLDILYKQMKDLSDLLAQTIVSGVVDPQVRANMGLAYTKPDMLALYKSVHLVPDQTKSGYNVLEKNREVAIQSLKLGVEQLYDGIILSSKGIKLQEEVVAVDAQQLKIAEDKFNNGLMSQNDYTSTKIKDKQDKLKLNSQKRSLQGMFYSLNKMLGLDLSTTYANIDQQIQEIPLPDIDIDKAKADALSNRAELYSLNEDSKNFQKELFFTQIYYQSGDSVFDSLAIKIEANKENIANTTDDIQFELEDAADEIEQNYNNIEKSKSELESANKSYDSVKSKYDQGLITKDILDASHISVTAAELGLMSSISTYNISVKKFEAAIGVGPKFN